MTPVNVAIIDDQDLVRMGLRMMLTAQPDIHVVAEGATGADALDIAAQGNVDVILMDVRMPVMDGIDATRKICGHGSLARVLILTTFDLDEYAFAAIKAGASGFLLKDTRAEELVSAIRAVHSGDAVLAPSATRRLMEHFASATPQPVHANTRLARLTPREYEILLAIARGCSNDELGTLFFLAPSTVKTHIGHLLHKLQARDRAQLVIIAYEAGIVGSHRHAPTRGTRSTRAT